MGHDETLRQQLAKVIDWNEAHADFHAAVDNFPVKLRGRVPTGFPHSAWQLLEHIRLALWDILEFSRNARHKSPSWPEGYWPKTAEPPSAEAWDKSVAAVIDHIDAMRKLVTDPSRDLFAPLPHGTGQTLLREALLVGDHNAYHLGQLVLLRRALGAWQG
jgi:DinB superfamily